MSVEGDAGFWKWIAGGAVSLVGSVIGAWKYIDTRLEKKADKHTVNNQFHAINNELTHQRGTQAKLFDQMRENEQRAQDRHERLMERLSEIGR